MTLCSGNSSCTSRSRELIRAPLVHAPVRRRSVCRRSVALQGAGAHGILAGGRRGCRIAGMRFSCGWRILLLTGYSAGSAWAGGGGSELRLELGEKTVLELVVVPAGEFSQG